MRRTFSIFVAAAVLTACPGLLAAGQTEPAFLPEVRGGEGEALSAPKYFDPSQYEFIECHGMVPRRDLVARFGWWGVDLDGSAANVAEWEGLKSSTQFGDVDGLWSDGRRTLDFHATVLEDEGDQAGLYYYSPLVSADVDYERFLHRFGYDPIAGFNLTDVGAAPPPNYPADLNGAFWVEDSNVGRDYAIRVQEVNADFKGNLTDNIKWRLNVWSLKKEGLRQATALTHCYNFAGSGTRCHVLSQGQRIDWVTTQIEPGLEAKFGALSVEYAHTIRTFEQGDQLVFANYAGNAFAPLSPATDPRTAIYAFVPENVTEIDRIKAHADLGYCTDLYFLGYVGNTHNEFRQTDRKLHGLDARLTNRSYENLTVTVYGNTHAQENEAPPFALNDVYDPLLMRESEATLLAAGDGEFPHPVDRRTTAAGVKSRWRPFYDYCGLASQFAITGGYEWREIHRRFVDYELDFGPEVGVIDFSQPDTISNIIHVGAQQRWSPALDTFVRYTWKSNDYPLFGVVEGASFTESTLHPSVDAGVNSLLPETEHLVEIGGNWTPADNFVLNATFYLENTYNHSDVVRFDEDNYPFMVSAWWAPDCRWSFSGGYANFTNWINQDITMGGHSQTVFGGPHNGELEPSFSFTAPWRYTGEANVVDLGAAYAYTSRLRLLGGFQYVQGRNFFAQPPTPVIYSEPAHTVIPIEPYSDLPGYSRVEVNTFRYTAGIDYELTSNVDCFFRFIYYDFDNDATGYVSGTTTMALAGLSAVF